jgi:hypothetical protein
MTGAWNEAAGIITRTATDMPSLCIRHSALDVSRRNHAIRNVEVHEDVFAQDQ